MRNASPDRRRTPASLAASVDALRRDVLEAKMELDEIKQRLSACESQMARMDEVRALLRAIAQRLPEASFSATEKAHQVRAFAMAAIADGPGGSVADISEEELLKGFGQ